MIIFHTKWQVLPHLLAADSAIFSKSSMLLGEASRQLAVCKKTGVALKFSYPVVHSNCFCSEFYH